MFLFEPKCTAAESLRNFDEFGHRACIKCYILKTEICSCADSKAKDNSKIFRNIVFLLHNVIDQKPLLCG